MKISKQPKQFVWEEKFLKTMAPGFLQNLRKKKEEDFLSRRKIIRGDKTSVGGLRKKQIYNSSKTWWK